MKLEQKRWDSVHGWIPELTKTEIGDAQLILIFSAAPLWREQIQLRQIKDIYPHAHTSAVRLPEKFVYTGHRRFNCCNSN